MVADQHEDPESEVACALEHSLLFVYQVTFNLRCVCGMPKVVVLGRVAYLRNIGDYFSYLKRHGLVLKREQGSRAYFSKFLN